MCSSSSVAHHHLLLRRRGSRSPHLRRLRALLCRQKGSHLGGVKAEKKAGQMCRAIQVVLRLGWTGPLHRGRDLSTTQCVMTRLGVGSCCAWTRPTMSCFELAQRTRSIWIGVKTRVTWSTVLTTFPCSPNASFLWYSVLQI